jgi:ATP-dependent Lon protease
LKRILEKIAFKLVKQVILPENTYEVTPENLKSLIGLPVFGERKMYTGIPPAGIIYGLAYNSYGGSVLTIETMKCNTTT